MSLFSNARDNMCLHKLPDADNVLHFSHPPYRAIGAASAVMSALGIGCYIAMYNSLSLLSFTYIMYLWPNNPIFQCDNVPSQIQIPYYFTSRDL